MRNSRQGRLEKPLDGPSGREPDSPAQQTSDCAFQTVLEDVRVNKALRWASEDAHKMRLKQLKAKLTKHIDETEWMYDSLDTILGFKLDLNSEKFQLKLKPLGELKKKKKRVVIEEIPYEPPEPLKIRYGKCQVVYCPCEETTQNARLYKIPEDDATRQEWMKLCGVQTLPKHAWICQIHFDFEDLHSFKCRQMMADGRNCVCSRSIRVQKGALPKHFLPADVQKRIEIKNARSKRVEKRDQKRMVHEILAKVTVANPAPPLTENAPGENYETNDSRHFLPEEFVDRSWLIIPEDYSNLQVISDSDDIDYDNFEPIVKDDFSNQEEAVEPEPDIFFLGDQCRICAEKCKNEVQIFGEEDHSALINECLPIKVSKDDTLPLVVCFSCLEEVKVVKTLYTKCGAADVILKGHLAKQTDYETYADDQNSVVDEMGTNELEPENDMEEDLLLSGVTFVEPIAAMTNPVPENTAEVNPENLPSATPAAPPTSTLPLECTESSDAPEQTDIPSSEQPDAEASKADSQTEADPKILKKTEIPKRVEPRPIKPNIPLKKPRLPFVSSIPSKQMPKLPGEQVIKPPAGPLQEDVNKQVPQKKKLVGQRPHLMLLSNTKKELSPHFVDQLKGILSNVSPRPIYLVPRDSSKSSFLVIPEQLKSGKDNSSQSAGNDKNPECEPSAAKKARVVEMKTGMTYEV